MIGLSGTWLSSATTELSPPASARRLALDTASMASSVATGASPPDETEVAAGIVGANAPLVASSISSLTIATAMGSAMGSSASGGGEQKDCYEYEMRMTMAMTTNTTMPTTTTPTNTTMATNSYDNAYEDDNDDEHDNVDEDDTDESDDNGD